MSMQSTLNCPQCREPIPSVLKDFKIAGCAACGQVSALNKDGQLYTIHSAKALKPRQQEPFQLGKQLQYRNVKYTVASVFVYEVNFQEWDSEDSKWVKDKGLITEWYAYDDQHRLLTIMRDTDGKFYVVSNPVQVRVDAPFNKKNTKEFGQYQLRGFAGTDDAALETLGYYRTYVQYTLECANENFENAAIVKYELTRLLPVQVKRMGVLDDLEKLKASENFATTTFYRNLFGFAFVVILALLIFVDGMNEGRKQTSPDIKFVYTQPNGDLDTVGFKPKLAGTFDLTAGKNYQFTANCSLDETNQSVDYSLTMVRLQDAVVVNDVALSFYTESGTDTDGYWEESLLSDQFMFQVEKTGKYQIFVAPDYENLWQFPSASLALQIEPTAYGDFYFWGGIFFLLLLLIFQWQRENLIAFANLPHATILHDLYESFS